MKRCPECKRRKSLSDFAFSNKAKGKRQPYCDPCRRKRAKVSYKKYKKQTIKAVIARNNKMYERFQEFKKTLSCEKCGENEPSCLDFHHKDSKQKSFTISESVAQVGWDRLMEEIKKCAVLCANCHRKLHAGVIKPSW